MNSLLAALSALLLAQAVGNGVVRNSTSPDGQYQVAVQAGHNGCSFQVTDRNGMPASDSFLSDFGLIRSIETQGHNTRVHWSKDSQFLVIDSDHNRHHLDFLVLQRKDTRFNSVPFDWEKIWNDSMPPHDGFGYPSFGAWLEGDKLQVRISRWDGWSRSTTDAEFVVNPSLSMRVLSSKPLSGQSL